MMGFGLLSVVVAAFLLSRQKDVKRLFAYSSIEHMGIITFAFGMGGPIATFAGLLHMTVHSLTKSAIFFAVGHAAQKAGTQMIDDIRGLITRQPDDRLGPDARRARDPRHAAVRRVRERVPDPHHRDARAAVGDAVPAASRSASRSRRSSATCSRWCSARPRRKRAAAPAGDAAGVRASGDRADARPVHSAVPRRLVSPGGGHDRDERYAASKALGFPDQAAVCIGGQSPVWLARVDARARGPRAAGTVREAGGRLVALWGADRQRPRASAIAVAYALKTASGASVAGRRCRMRDASVSRICRTSFRRRRACSAPSTICSALQRRRCRRYAAVAATTAAGHADVFPLREDFVAAPSAFQPQKQTIRSCTSKAMACTKFAVGPVHAGIIEPGHFRFSVVGEKVLRLEERLGYAHKGIEKRFAQMSRLAGHRLAGRVSGDTTVAFAWAYCMAVEAASRRHGFRRARMAARAAARARAHRQPSGRPGLPRQRRRASLRAGAVFAAEGGLAAPERRAVRPPLSDGRHRARRRARRHRCRGCVTRCCTQCDADRAQSS